MRSLVETLRALPVASRISVAITEYESSDFSLVDVNCAGLHEGRGAPGMGRRPAASGEPRSWRSATTSTTSTCYRRPGVPVVMGNAVDALKQLGWPLTLTNDEGGVAAAIRHVRAADRG